MTEHIVSSFEEELESLSTMIARMGGLAESQLADAIDALARSDSALAEMTVAADRRIDALEREIEHQAVRLLALRQPMALDLRETISALKISSELERVGDLAKNVAKRTQVLSEMGPIRPIKGLARMGRLVLGQLKDTLDAYSARNEEKAISVWRRDEEIDDMYNSLFREMVTYMMEDPRTLSYGAHLLFIAKNFERVGDHCTNIAEVVHFMVSGAPLEEDRPKGDVTSYTAVPPRKEKPTEKGQPE